MNKLPKEYYILKLRLLFNKELLENNIITFDLYSKMQQSLITKMNKYSFNGD